MITRKTPFAWKKVWKPKPMGGQNIIELSLWNKVNLIKLLWNVCQKTDNLWIKWIHTYCVKRENILIMEIKDNYS